MKKHKKILTWGMGGLILLLILAAGFVLLPYLIDLEPVRDRILLKLSQELGGQVKYDRLALSYFPRPRVMIHQVTLSVPGTVTGKLKSVEIYPALLALLRGKPHISKILVESPDFSIRLPEKTKKTVETTAPRPLEEIRNVLSRAFAVMTSNLPNLTVIINNGSLNLQGTAESIISFNGIEARLTGPPGNFEVDMTCASNLWEKVSMKAEINPTDFTGDGDIDLVNFHPHSLFSTLDPNAQLDITDSRIDLGVSFKIKGIDSLQAEIEGSIPLLAFHGGNKNVVIRGKGLKGAFRMEGDRIDLSLQNLNLDYPRLILSGTFQIDQKTPAYVLEVEGREMDVVSTREVALALAGKIPITRTIFTMVRGGQVPSITFQSRGQSMGNLDDTENLSLKGDLLDGMIFISGEDFGLKGIDFSLESVSGNVVISKGIAEIKNLSARWENHLLREGMMRAGLEGKDAPFHLEVIADADLPSLPPLLSRLIKEKAFLEELSRIHDLKGRALGKIILGERTGSLKTRVEIQEMNLTAHYGRIPYPVEIDQGQFSFDGERIGLKDLSGKVGASSFSGFTANLGLGKKQDLDILSGALSLVLGEVHSWLSSVEAVKDLLKDVPSLKGVLNLNTVKLGGPISSPGDWRFETAGELRGVEVKARSFPWAIAIASGKFMATQKELSLNNFQTKLLNASFNVSGSLQDYLRGVEKGDLDLRGSMTSRDIHQFSSFLGLKSGIFIRSALSISEGHLSWTKTGDTLFKGNIAVKEGPQISLDILRGTDRLKVNRLRINDAASQADMTFDFQGRTLGVTFSGELSERTLDRIFVGYQFQDGWARGDFRAKIDLDQPMESTAQGKINVHALTLPWQFKKPLEISEISLDAQKNRVSVVLAILAWGEERFALSGDVNFSKEKIKLDIDLSAGKIDLEELQEVFGNGEKRPEKKPTLSVEGTIRLWSGSLTFQRYTWTPFIADISLGDGGVEVNVKKANLCGMDTPGIVKVRDKNVFLNIEPFFKGQEIESAFRCLLNHQVRVTGNFEFYGRILARGRPEELVKSLEGDIEFHAKDGRIDYLLGLVRILDFLNVMEIYRGKLPDLKKEPLPYDRITIRGTLQNGKMIIKEWTIDGPTLELTSQGEIDLADQKINLTVLVAPFKTVDRITKVIPLLSYIFAGTLVTIPVKVDGDLKDPKVRFFPASAVGAELLAMMKRTLGLPFKMIDSFLPSERENK
ncbi:MAG: hypothetical protein A2W09_06080 [Deltaproteobacteria bacterium RBG_16_50_11]|nr:MAG: hypothetical protein A2W09_06080 [Deltaproteobacteria bacterium RBG_16_50_11]